MKKHISLISLVLLLLPLISFTQSNDLRESEASGSLVKPAHVPFQEKDLLRLKLPAGYTVSVFAKNLVNPRFMVVDREGTVYVSRPKSKDILALRDENGDGVVDRVSKFVHGYDRVHGMALHQDQLYFIAMKKVYVANLKNPSRVRLLIADLPDVGQHENRSLAIGPDHLLYISIGSNCNACVDPNKKMATMLVANLDGSDLRIYASGLRDTIGFDWHPETGQLYGWDHGTDWRGDAIPKEELNLLEPTKHYGWPFCWNERKPDLNFNNDPEGQSKEDFCKSTEPPILTYHAHAAPLGFKFYQGSMLTKDKNSAFVAMHGSWNRKQPVGYNVSRVIFEQGKAVRVEEFLTGFLAKDRKSQFGRPAGLAVAADGALLVSDDAGGVIYRIAYQTP